MGRIAKDSTGAEASIHDVARKARVSIASVSRVMNGHPRVGEETRRRVQTAVRSLNYVPHGGARSLSTRRTHVVGVLLPDLHGEFFSELIRGIDLVARDRGRQLLLSSVHGGADELAGALRTMRGKVDGLLVMSPHVSGGLLERNLPSTLPTVLINSPPGGTRHPRLAIDSYRGARAMVAHLVARGHRRIAHVAGPKDNYDAQERLRGYRDEMARSLPRAAPVTVPGDFTQESGYRAGQKLAARSERPDAVFAANDVLAIGCLMALREAGLRVPEEVAVAGFDDIPLASLVSPALTTMRVHIADLGRAALEQLLAAIERPLRAQPAARALLPEVVVRQSCGLRQPESPNRRPRRPATRS
jgi:LacI family transcriptional regulator